MVGSNCQIQSWFIHVLSTAFDTGHPSGGPDLPRPRQRTDRPVNKKKKLAVKLITVQVPYLSNCIRT